MSIIQGNVIGLFNQSSNLLLSLIGQNGENSLNSTNTHNANLNQIGKEEPLGYVLGKWVVRPVIGSIQGIVNKVSAFVLAFDRFFTLPLVSALSIGEIWQDTKNHQSSARKDFKSSVLSYTSKRMDNADGEISVTEFVERARETEIEFEFGRILKEKGAHEDIKQGFTEEERDIIYRGPTVVGIENCWNNRLHVYLSNIHNLALSKGYIGGLPIFKKMDQEVHFYKKGAVILKNVLKDELGVHWVSQPEPDLLIYHHADFCRAVNQWAKKNGYAAGIPNFHEDAKLVGVLVFKAGTIVEKNLSQDEVGIYEKVGPTAVISKVNEWARKNGYGAGFPTFENSKVNIKDFISCDGGSCPNMPYGGDVSVVGVILIPYAPQAKLP